MTTSEPEEAESPVELSELEFVRLKIPHLLPVEFVESVKGKTFSVERFYRFQEEQKGNPNNLLYAVIDTGKKIHGFLWAEINMLDHSLFVNTFSISKEYWGKGEAIGFVGKFLKDLAGKFECPRVYWMTTNQKFFRKHGFKSSKNVCMEYILD